MADPATSRAWVVRAPAPAASRPGPLALVTRPRPVPGPGQVRVRVRVCGVCRTDLHLAEGDLTPRRPGVVPGHEAVGEVDALGEGAVRFRLGERVGIAWLGRTCGECRWCRSGAENLCPRSTYTGWDVDGGYAEHAVADEHYVHRLPEDFGDVRAAPLLCAGIIGYRALRLANLPERGGRLGIYGFGASAHLTAQVALWRGARVHVMTRAPRARELALSLGASSASGADEPPPEPLDAAILFAPVGTLVPVALRALDRGGTLAVAGIHLSDIPLLVYERDLFYERTLRSVTSNTRVDGQEFLDVAARAGITVTTTEYPFEQADLALADLAADRVEGAAVLTLP